MDLLESVKRYLEKGGEENSSSTPANDALPFRFFEPFVVKGLHVDLIERGHIICSMKVPQRLLNSGNMMHGGATATLVDLVTSAAIYTVGSPVTGVSVEINVSYFDAAYAGEEIEIEAKNLLVGKAIAVVGVEFRKKKTGKVIAVGRQTKYLAISSNM